MLGAGLTARRILRWCWVDRGVAVERGTAGRREAEATPLEISKEESLEVAAEYTLDLEG